MRSMTNHHKVNGRSDIEDCPAYIPPGTKQYNQNVYSKVCLKESKSCSELFLPDVV